MTPGQAKALAPRLEAAGLLLAPYAGKNSAGASHRSVHGTAAVEGKWAHNDRRHAEIVCPTWYAIPR